MRKILKNAILLFVLLCGNFETKMQASNLALNFTQKTSEMSASLQEISSSEILDENLSEISAQNLSSNLQNSLNFKSLFLNADSVVKAVIYILCAFSIFSWALFFYKSYEFYHTKKVLKFELKLLNKTSDLNALNLAFCKAFLELVKNEKPELKLRLESKMDAQISSFKSGLSALASIAASAPFIGLFGTVWGIMHSFMNIAALKNASLVVVAPGIAEALFATAFGLIAAIPAVLFYNFLLAKSVNLEHILDECVSLIYALRQQNAA